MNKRNFCAGMAAVIIAGLIPITADATASGTCGENLFWTLDNYGTLTIQGTGVIESGPNGDIPWLYHKPSIKNVVIGEGVTGITYAAFSFECKALSSVSIPRSVEYISFGAFENCVSLTSIAIPDGTEEIDGFAFSNCTSLSDITISDSVKIIGEDVFENTAYYNNPDNWENGALYIGNHLVDVDESVTSITIKNGTRTIADGAFENCRNLTEITIPEGITRIGESVFCDCSALTKVVLPEGITEIGYAAFDGCNALEDIVIPGSVSAIGDWAFDECTNLSKIVIPEGVKRIGTSTFEECVELTSITLPDSITEIGRNAFDYCFSLTEISIPNGVVSIADGAFDCCRKLKEINIPDGVTSFGYETFRQCESLESIKIPSASMRIGKETFADCTGLTSVIIPESIVRIEDDAFSGCTNISDVHYKGTEEQWKAIVIGSNNEYLTGANIHYEPSERIPQITSDIKVVLNGYDVYFDVPPLIINDRTMVPMRSVFEALMYCVNWNPADKSITATGAVGTITMQVGSNIINRNGESIEADVAPVIVEGRTLIPLRAVGEALNSDVQWDESSRTVYINGAENTSVIELSGYLGKNFYNAIRDFPDMKDAGATDGKEYYNGDLSIYSPNNSSEVRSIWIYRGSNLAYYGTEYIPGSQKIYSLNGIRVGMNIVEVMNKLEKDGWQREDDPTSGRVDYTKENKEIWIMINDDIVWQIWYRIM